MWCQSSTMKGMSDEISRHIESFGPSNPAQHGTCLQRPRGFFFLLMPVSFLSSTRLKSHSHHFLLSPDLRLESIQARLRRILGRHMCATSRRKMLSTGLLFTHVPKANSVKLAGVVVHQFTSVKGNQVNNASRSTFRSFCKESEARAPPPRK